MNKRVTKVLSYVSLGLFFLLLLSCATTKPATTTLGEPKSEQFYSSKSIIDKAVTENAQEFAPQYYREAVDHYFAAERAYEEGKGREEIQKELEKAEKSAQKSIDITQAMKINFPELIDSRKKAMSAGADERELKDYREAEKLLDDIASTIERDGMEKAREKAQTATRKYETAELEAIKLNIVGNLNEQLEKLEKQGARKWAPKTYQEAKMYRDSAIETLEQNRYNQQQARQEVDQGEYYANKAMFLTARIKEASAERENWEELYLQREEDIKEIASPLQVEPSFDEGFEEPVEMVKQTVSDLKEEKQALARQLSNTQQKLVEAQVEIQQAEQRKESIASQLEKAEMSLQQRKMIEERVKKIQELLPKEKTKVLLDPDYNVTITLTGLSFDLGKSTLKEEDYSLLSDVYKAAQMFPEPKMKITGHTDSTGSSAFNKKLSLERAKSVANFMEKGLGFPSDRIEVVGAGESEPIAPNNTPEGRKLNRRIDITLLTEY